LFQRTFTFVLIKANVKNNTAAGGTFKPKTQSLNKKSQKANSSFGHYTNTTSNAGQKSSIKSKKQSAAAIQNYFDNNKVILNSSGNYQIKNSSKKSKKKGYTINKKSTSNTGWDVLVNLSSSSRERKYATNNFNKTGSSNYNTGKFKKSFKQAAYNSYTNMTKNKKHPRASSNTDTAHMSLSRQEDNLIKSSHKKGKNAKVQGHLNDNNLLFKLKSELSHSPETVNVRNAYGKQSKKDKPLKVVPTFGIPGD